VDSVVVMGVSGSGKTTVGRALAERLGVPFTDGDDLHPAANLRKMTDGIPLTDSDRWPWLDAVGAVLAQGAHVVACSALRRSYRDRLRAAAPRLALVYLDVPREVVVERMAERPGHFMPASLLDSQLATLEPPDPAEGAMVVDATAPVAELVDEIADRLATR
jgi:carbohydrate kinase (thermoresistant glucokinase family)